MFLGVQGLQKSLFFHSKTFKKQLTKKTSKILSTIQFLMQKNENWSPRWLQGGSGGGPKFMLFGVKLPLGAQLGPKTLQEAILEPSWDDFGTILHEFWCNFGDNFGRL